MGKNICLFAANYLPNVGGVERYTYYLATFLTRKNNKVTIVTNNVFNLATHEVIDGVEIYRLDCHNVMNGRYPIYKKNANLKKILGELKEKNFDLVVVNTRFYFLSILGAKFAYKSKIKCITIEHGSTHLTVGNKILDTMGAAYEHTITARLKHYCKDYYGVSEACCKWSGHFGIKSKGVLYNSIDLDDIKYKIDNAEFSYREKYNIPKDATVVVFTGRLVEEKGILSLIEAFKKINRPNTYLFIAGNGPLEDEIRGIKDDKIFYLGSLENKYVIALLSETDIFCLPSKSEGLSTSVLEAVATKTFVITTKRGGSKELVCGEGYGIIMDTNSLEEIETALRRAFENPDYRTKGIENSYARLLKYFTWDKTTDKLLSLLD